MVGRSLSRIRVGVGHFECTFMERTKDKELKKTGLRGLGQIYMNSEKEFGAKPRCFHGSGFRGKSEQDRTLYDVEDETIS